MTIFHRRYIFKGLFFQPVMPVFRRVELAELAVWLHWHQVSTWISISPTVAIGQISSNKMTTKNQGPGVDLALSQAATP